MKTTLQLYNFYDRVAENISIQYKRDHPTDELVEILGSIAIGLYLDDLEIRKGGYRSQIRWRVKDLIDGKRKYRYH